MNKKTVISLMLIFLIICLTASCTTNITQSEYNEIIEDIEILQEQVEALTNEINEINSSANTQNSSFEPEEHNDKSLIVPITKEFDEASVLAQLEITEYQYISSIKTPWVFLVVKNNSEFNININIDLESFDGNGNIIGAKSSSQSAFESSTETILAFILDDKPASIDYSITLEEEDWYECVVSDLTYEVSSAANKEIVSITNTGQKAAEFVECIILFFNGNEVVGYDTNYFVDNDYELKSGKTITEELKCYEDYDSFKIYLTGHR